MKRILGRIRKACFDYSMIKDGDKIAVGVSGGKDSMVLLYALKLYQQFSTEKFEMCGIAIDPGFDNFDLSEITTFCKEKDIPLNIIKTDIYEIVFNIRKEKNPCALCANLRRGALHNAMEKLGCNVLALGHHRDDVVETFMLSMLYEGRLKTFKPKTYLDRRKIHVIRPMIYLFEQEIKSAHKEYNLPLVESPCPVDKTTKRQEMKDLLKTLYKDIPQSKNNLFQVIKSDKDMELWFKNKNFEEADNEA